MARQKQLAKEEEDVAFFRLHPVTLDAILACPDILEKIQHWFVKRGKHK